MTQTFHCSSHSPSAALHTRVCVCNMPAALVLLPSCWLTGLTGIQKGSFFLLIYPTFLRVFFAAQRSLSAAKSTRQGWIIAEHMATHGTQPGVQINFIFFPSLTELWLSCLDPSRDALSGHKMNSQVWLNNKELQSAAVLHPSVLGSDIKRFPVASLSQMKKAGFSLLHNIRGKFLEIKALMQWQASKKTASRILCHFHLTTWLCHWKSWCTLQTELLLDY